MSTSTSNPPLLYEDPDHRASSNNNNNNMVDPSEGDYGTVLNYDIWTKILSFLPFYSMRTLRLCNSSMYHNFCSGAEITVGGRDDTRIRYDSWGCDYGSTVNQVRPFRFEIELDRPLYSVDVMTTVPGSNEGKKRPVISIEIKLINPIWDERHNDRHYPMCRPLNEFPGDTEMDITVWAGMYEKQIFEFQSDIRHCCNFDDFIEEHHEEDVSAKEEDDLKCVWYYIWLCLQKLNDYKDTRNIHDRPISADYADPLYLMKLFTELYGKYYPPGIDMNGECHDRTNVELEYRLAPNDEVWYEFALREDRYDYELGEIP